MRHGEHEDQTEIKTLPKLSAELLSPAVRILQPGSCRAAADEVNYLDAIAIVEQGLGPLVATYDLLVDFDGDPLGSQRHFIDQIAQR